MIVSPGLDDKAGLYVAMEAFRLCARARLQVALFAVSTVQEEVGLRGARTSAFGVDPDVGIAIDVTHATDNPGSGKKRVPVKLNAGPTICRGPNINPEVEKRFIKVAKANRIPYQLEPSPRPLSNDVNALQVARAGVAAASIGIPNRYMHTQAEICSVKDLDNAAKLLAAFIKGVTSRTSFVPV